MESDFRFDNTVSKMAAMTSFHAGKCCHLLSENEASTEWLCSSVCQFLIYSTFILVTSIRKIGPCGARGRCRISPPCFLAESRKRRLNQGSFVSAVCLIVYFLLFVLCLCVCIFVLYIEYFPYCLFVSNSQVIGCEDRPRNDLYCVGWGVKLYSIQSS